MVRPSDGSIHSPYKIGGFYYLVLLVLAVVFYKERALFGDIPYHVFHLLREGDYTIQNQRFGAFVTQTPPLLALKAGASIQTVAIIYSVTFGLLYLTIFGLLAWMKNARMAVVMLLLSSLMVTDTFYWIQSELPQGLAFMLLAFGMLTRVEHWRKLSIIEYIILVPLHIMLAYFHPLLFIPYTFTVAFLYMDAEQYRVDWRLLLGGLAAFWLIFVLKNTLLKAESTYESHALSGLDNFATLFPNYFFFPNSAAFFTQLLTTTMVGVFIALLYHYPQTKNYKKLGFVIAGVLSYWLLVTVTHATATFSGHYMENLYLPLSVLLAVPFAYDVLPVLPKRAFHWFLASIVVVATVRIAAHRSPYTARRYWQRNLLAATAEMPNKKLLIKAEDVPKDLLMGVYWSSPFEFWMMSQIDRPQEPPRSIVIDDGSMSLGYLLHTSNKHFATYWGDFPYWELDCRYFDCSDTSYYVPYVPHF